MAKAGVRRRRNVDSVNDLIQCSLYFEDDDTTRAASMLMAAAVILGHEIGVSRAEMLATVEDLLAKCEANAAKQEVARG